MFISQKMFTQIIFQILVYFLHDESKQHDLSFLEKFDKFVRITPTEWNMYMSKESCENNCTGTEAFSNFRS